jgi:hypothetical protein
MDYTQYRTAHALLGSSFLNGDSPLLVAILTNLLAAAVLLCGTSGTNPAVRARWRTATEPELRKLIPARAPVLKENIETEFRTASGVTDGSGQFIAGVVMITAGYSAEGKYSHFFITQTPLRIGGMLLQSGEYVFGYQRMNNDAIRISFYRASSGEGIGSVEAHVNRKSSMVRSLLISPPVNGRAQIQIGRFFFEYKLSD